MAPRAPAEDVEETELDFLAAIFEDVRAIRRYLAIWFGLSMTLFALAVVAIALQKP